MNRSAFLTLLAASALTLSSGATAQTSEPVDPSAKQPPAEEKVTPPPQDNQAKDTPTEAKEAPAEAKDAPAQAAEPKTAAEAAMASKPAKPPISIEAVKEKAKKLSPEQRKQAEQ